jgi:transcriptional regulator with XRE-family HTH domain
MTNWPAPTIVASKCFDLYGLECTLGSMVGRLMTEPVKKTRRRRVGNRAFDAHVGQRVRLRRTLLGMSQERLGDALGLTFQQVQKYERGANRISAGTLYRLAQILDVPISFFFDGIEELPGGAGGAPLPTDAGDALLTRREARILRLSRQAPGEIVEQMVGLLAAVCRDPADVEVVEIVEGGEGLTEAATAPRRRYGAVWDPTDIGETGTGARRSR